MSNNYPAGVNDQTINDHYDPPCCAECKHFHEICGDWGICEKALLERFGVEADPLKVVEWCYYNVVGEEGVCERFERI